MFWKFRYQLLHAAIAAVAACYHFDNWQHFLQLATKNLKTAELYI